MCTEQANFATDELVLATQRLVEIHSHGGGDKIQQTSWRHHLSKFVGVFRGRYHGAGLGTDAAKIIKKHSNNLPEHVLGNCNASTADEDKILPKPSTFEPMMVKVCPILTNIGLVLATSC